jgi:EAL domain-containing protein (putative c-di-GMP-specific phosphodiesterase class I)
VAKRRELEAAIDEAIRTSAFTLVYQPIVVLGSDEVVGVVLMPEHQKLGVFRLVPAGHQHNQPE